MAYYAQNMTKQAVQAVSGLGEPLRMDGVGAYYAYDATHEAVQPINGLALGAAAEIADDAMRSIVGTRRPVMIAGEWAERAGDLGWRAPKDTKNDLTLVPVTSAEVLRVRAEAFGNDAVVVGVLMPELLALATIERAFEDTPYRFERLIAVYDAARPRSPAPLFLALARPRDAADEDGGSGSLEAVARSLSGVLVYPIALPTRGRPRLPPLARVLLAGRAPGGPAPAPQAPVGFVQRGMLGTVTTPEVVVGVAALAGVAALGAFLLRRNA